MARKAGSDGEKTAQAIRREAMHLFAAHGYAAVTMRMIADAVGVQPAAIYQYHKTKQTLLVDLLETHMHRALRAWEAEEMAGEPPRAALDRFVRFHIRYHISKPDEIFISYMELRALEPEGFARIEHLRKRYETALKSIVERGMADNSFVCEDAPVTTMAILAMLTGVNTWYREGGRLSPERIEDIYAHMIARSVGCREREGEGGN